MRRGHTSRRERDLRAAEALFQQGAYPAALAAYESIRATFPGWRYAEHASMMAGICHAKLGRLADALRVLEQTTREYPDLAGFSEATWFYLGDVYEERGRLADAAAAFRRTLALTGSRARSRFPAAAAAARLAELGISEWRCPRAGRARRCRRRGESRRRGTALGRGPRRPAPGPRVV